MHRKGGRVVSIMVWSNVFRRQEVSSVQCARVGLNGLRVQNKAIITDSRHGTNGVSVRQTQYRHPSRAVSGRFSRWPVLVHIHVVKAKISWSPAARRSSCTMELPYLSTAEVVYTSHARTAVLFLPPSLHGRERRIVLQVNTICRSVRRTCGFLRVLSSIQVFFPW